MVMITKNLISNLSAPLVEWMTAIGTVFSSLAAAYFGAVKPYCDRAKFKIHTPENRTSFLYHDINKIHKGEEGDIVEVGFLVEQVSGTPARNVNILVTKIWRQRIIEGKWGEMEEWKHFVPSTLKWAAKEANFAKGVQRYCHLGSYGENLGSDFAGNLFYLATSENDGDLLFDSFSSVLPQEGRYQIDCLVSGENVRELNFKIGLSIYGVENMWKGTGPDGDMYNIEEKPKMMDAIEARIL